MWGARLRVLLTVGCALAIALAVGLPAISAGHARAAKGCASPDVSSPRDPTNPLALPTAPSNGSPLEGANFFVDGPRHGNAAGAVAQKLGLNPKSFPEDESWDTFKADHANAIANNRDASDLSKIANGQETQNISTFSEGGGPGGIGGQTTKILCTNMAADHREAPVAVFSTFMIYPNDQECAGYSAMRAYQDTFHRDVDAMAAAIGNKRAVILEEIDSIAISGCVRGPALKLWLADLKYENTKFSQLPHAVVYEEAGYSDAEGAGWTAKRLWAAGINKIRGFFTNDTHMAWTINEIRWAENVSDDINNLSHGRYRAHFVVNTAQNGKGPKLNPHPVKQGIENLCNPPGRGLGPMPTGDPVPSFKYLDGYLWTGVPGRSHSDKCPNGPWKPGGTFDPRFALELAQNANQKLGSGYPSRPY
jgi:endoglucanase